MVAIGDGERKEEEKREKIGKRKEVGEEREKSARTKN